MSGGHLDLLFVHLGRFTVIVTSLEIDITSFNLKKSKSIYKLDITVNFQRQDFLNPYSQHMLTYAR